MNPLFGMPLMQKGVSVNSILFFRYIIAVAVLGLFLLLTKQKFKVSAKQAGVLIILGTLVFGVAVTFMIAATKR